MNILLLGAGFSRNWGGLLADEVFEALIALPQIQQDNLLRPLLWRHSGGLMNGGFEGALEELESNCQSQPDAYGPSLQTLRHGLLTVFEEMNNALLQGTLELQVGDAKMQTFLLRFGAIYTLNQDVFLEHNYSPKVHLASQGNLSPDLPGMTRTNTKEGWAEDFWIPSNNSDEFIVKPRTQPLFKLHGSSNWRLTEGGDLAIWGGNKTRAIQEIPLLRWYFEQFRDDLEAPQARLFVIGYSFRDSHVNDVISDAVRRGLRFFVLDTNGADVARRTNSSYGPGSISSDRSPLEERFEEGLIGASRRTLRETFGTDTVSYANVMRFFKDDVN
jgi:hypothetical protein